MANIENNEKYDKLVKKIMPRILNWCLLFNVKLNSNLTKITCVLLIFTVFFN